MTASVCTGILPLHNVHDLEVTVKLLRSPIKCSWPADLVQAHAATTSHTVRLTQNHNMNTITALTLNLGS